MSWYTPAVYCTISHTSCDVVLRASQSKWKDQYIVSVSLRRQYVHNEKWVLKLFSLLRYWKVRFQLFIWLIQPNVCTVNSVHFLKWLDFQLHLARVTHALISNPSQSLVKWEQSNKKTEEFKKQRRHLPSGPVVKNLPRNSGERGSDPWLVD